MITLEPDLTTDKIVDVLADYIEPIAGICYQTQANRVPMHTGQFCMLTLINFKRLGTTQELKADTGDSKISSLGYTEVRTADVQVDIYGLGAAERAYSLETLFASSHGYDNITSIDERVAPLYSNAPRNRNYTNSESQWQDLYTLTLTVQVHITVQAPQSYFGKVEVSTAQVNT